ncbi:MAG: DUF1579 family protein [Kofleriaceae bacterium]
MKLAALALVLACTHASPVAAPTTAKACEGPEYRQLDFWVGDWTLNVHARSKPGVDEWRDTHGTQHITRTLQNCAIEENFSALPPIAFAGRSFSMFDAIAKRWRQTWVDDSGSYLAFTGGPEGDGFALYGEPRELGGKPFQMRMVWSKITPTSLRWEWQRSEDNWATTQVMIAIDYVRAT